MAPHWCVRQETRIFTQNNWSIGHIIMPFWYGWKGMDKKKHVMMWGYTKPLWKKPGYGWLWANIWSSLMQLWSPLNFQQTEFRKLDMRSEHMELFARFTRCASVLVFFAMCDFSMVSNRPMFLSWLTSSSLTSVKACLKPRRQFPTPKGCVMWFDEGGSATIILASSNDWSQEVLPRPQFGCFHHQECWWPPFFTGFKDVSLFRNVWNQQRFVNHL